VLGVGAALVGGSIGVWWKFGRCDSNVLHGRGCSCKDGRLASLACIFGGHHGRGRRVQRHLPLGGAQSLYSLLVAVGWFSALLLSCHSGVCEHVSTRQKPSCLVGVGNDDTLTSCSLPWRCCCGAYVLLFEALWVKIQFSDLDGQQ
jgi:hypothetical protein